MDTWLCASGAGGRGHLKSNKKNLCEISIFPKVCRAGSQVLLFATNFKIILYFK